MLRAQNLLFYGVRPVKEWLSLGILALHTKQWQKCTGTRNVNYSPTNVDPVKLPEIRMVLTCLFNYCTSAIVHCATRVENEEKAPSMSRWLSPDLPTAQPGC